MGRRTLLLIASLVIAAVGTVMIFLYLRGAEQSAVNRESPVQVLIAAKRINAGTPVAKAVAAGAFALTHRPRSAIEPDALADLRAVQNQVAIGPILPGQQIVLGQFGDAAKSLSQVAVPAGRMSVSIQLTDPGRVAGLIALGSQVTVFVTLTTGGGEGTGVLLPKVEVVGIGPNALGPESAATALGSGSRSGSGSRVGSSNVSDTVVTLAVTVDEAKKLIYASTKGELYLGLLDENTGTVSASAPMATSANLFKAAS